MNRSSRGWFAFRPFLVLAALAMAVLPGCGPAKAKVSGTVNFGGQPLPSGTITFQSEAGNKKVKAGNIADGKYTITDLEAGPAKVTVTTTPPPTEHAPLPNVTPIQPPAGSPAPAPPGKYVAIPKKYGIPDLSGLEYDVKAGDQTKDFDLTP